MKTFFVPANSEIVIEGLVRTDAGDVCDALDDGHAVQLELAMLLRVVGEEPHARHLEIGEDLRVQGERAEVGTEPESMVRLDRVESLVLQGICEQFVFKPYTPTFLTHVQQNSLTFFFNLPQSLMKLVAAVTPQ